MTTLIYFFGTDFGRVKIGRCKGNLYNRRKQIQNGCPDPIKLLGVILCGDQAEMRKREYELHRQFQEYRTMNEWYQLTPEISTYIEEFTISGDDILQEHHEMTLEQRREDRKRPEAREQRRKYKAAYYECPEARERKREYDRKYNRMRRKRAKSKKSSDQLTLF